MGLLSRRLGVQAMSLEDPSQPLLPYSSLIESLGLGRSDAGVMVNERQAMRITTAQACVKIISEDLASTAHEILLHLPDGSVRPAPEHRLWRLIHDEPNPMMTAKVFWGCMLACELAWGNGYGWIKRDGAARVISLVPLAPDKTAPVKINGQLMYGTTQTDTGAVAYIDPANMLHFVGLTFDGITGMSPIQSCKNAFGLAMAAEKFGAQFFGNGARATGVLSHPGQLDPEAQENLAKSVREMATGEKALGTIILEEGMNWQQITINPDDAQFLGTRQFQRSEIASLYRVAMHLLQDLTRSTNNNIEHQSLDHIRYCLRPKAVGIEQEVKRKLLSGPFSMEHNLADMQRGDFASQTTGIQVLRNIGYYSNNDIARALRQNPTSAEEGGDLRVIQGAMIPLTSLMSSNAPADPVNEPDGAGDGTQPFDRVAPAFRRLMRDAVGRVVNRANRDGEFVSRTFQPVVAAMVQAVLAVQFGNCELTTGDRRVINGLLVDIVGSASVWERGDATAIANRLTAMVYERFCQGSLE